MAPRHCASGCADAEIDAGEAAGVSSEERRELRELRRKKTASWNNDRNPKGRNKFLRAGVRLATLVICEFIDANREAARSESGRQQDADVVGIMVAAAGDECDVGVPPLSPAPGTKRRAPPAR